MSSNLFTKAQRVDRDASARRIEALAEPTDNIYQAINVISTRSRQISDSLKHELNDKLEEFSHVVEPLEEIVENKEQIEISKNYEKLASPTLIATDEYVSEELSHEFGDYIKLVEKRYHEE